MNKHAFGWSYPPGCSGPPEEPEYSTPRCKVCGCFLSIKGHRYEPYEDSSMCDGKVDFEGLALCGYAGKEHPPHKVIWDAGALLVLKCRHCGTENKFS
jgi:hypothetical protein